MNSGCRPHLENAYCWGSQAYSADFRYNLGGDYATSMDECIARCRGNNDCKSFLYESKYNWCNLFNELCSSSEASNYHPTINHYAIDSCLGGKKSYKVPLCYISYVAFIQI